MSHLRWILFRSSATVAPWPATMLDIVRVTERNNSAAGATGMLLFMASEYLQYVEAAPDQLDPMWARIAADTRHRILWKVEGSMARRRFPGLPLGYFDAEREHAAAQRTPIWDSRRAWRADQADALIAMLESIAREKYPAALGGGAPPRG